MEGADRVIRNRDVHFPFRQDSSFYYLTGIAEPKVCAILIPDAKEDRYILFSEPKNYDIEKWTGFVMGHEDAVKKHGATEAYELNDVATDHKFVFD